MGQSRTKCRRSLTTQGISLRASISASLANVMMDLIYAGA